MYTESTITESKKIREALAGRTEVLDNVKRLFFIPKLELATMRQVADYFEVDIDTIKKVYKLHIDEINADGVTMKKVGDFKGEGFSPLKNSQRGATSFHCGDGMVLTISNMGVKCFTKRAVLRIAMLLRDSEIAREVRNQLLNIFENSTEEQRVEEIRKEENFLSECVKSLVSGDREAFLNSFQDYVGYMERAVNELKESNDAMEKANLLIARGVCKWGNKQILNAIIRDIGYKCFHCDFPHTWSVFYKRLEYSTGISCKKRREENGSGGCIGTIKEHEWSEVLRVAAAWCVELGLDVPSVINSINAEKVNRLSDVK